MALNTCPDCGKPVSSEANACPHCGRPQGVSRAAPEAPKARQTRPAFKVVGAVILALIVWAWIASEDDRPVPAPPEPVPDSATSPPQPAPDSATSPSQPAPEDTVAAAPPPVYKTTASELVLAYDQNEVATNKKIGGAVVEVSGRIASIDMDFRNHAVIRLATGMDFESVGLRLEDSQKELAASLVKGQSIVIGCKKMMRVVHSPRGDDCVIVGAQQSGAARTAEVTAAATASSDRCYVVAPFMESTTGKRAAWVVGPFTPQECEQKANVFSKILPSPIEGGHMTGVKFASAPSILHGLRVWKCVPSDTLNPGRSPGPDDIRGIWLCPAP